MKISLWCVGGCEAKGGLPRKPQDAEIGQGRWVVCCGAWVFLQVEFPYILFRQSLVQL